FSSRLAQLCLERLHLLLRRATCFSFCGTSRCFSLECGSQRPIVAERAHGLVVADDFAVGQSKPGACCGEPEPSSLIRAKCVVSGWRHGVALKPDKCVTPPRYAINDDVERHARQLILLDLDRAIDARHLW